MNIVILGNGAIGSLWLFHLNALNNTEQNNVSVITNNCENTNQASFTNYSGVSFKYCYQIATAKQLADADLLIVCLKSTHCAQVLNNLKHQLNPNADIVLSHNGTGVIEALDETLKVQHNIYTMLTTHGCYRVTKHHVIHTGLGHCDIGLSRGNVKNKPPRWFELLNNALPVVYWQEDILTKQWQKLAINSVINPLTAIYKVKNGAIATDRFAKSVKTIANEVAIVANSQGISLTADFIEQQALLVAQKTAKNTSSMLADVLAGKTTEINNINGYICKLGKQHNVDVSFNQNLTNQVNQVSQVN